MDIYGIGNGMSAYGLANSNITDESTIKAESLKDDLNNLAKDSSDEELMEVCESFEAYMVQKLFEQMRSTVKSSEEEDNEYMSMFGDTLYEQYANEVASSRSLGISQMLFESIKRNTNE